MEDILSFIGNSMQVRILMDVLIAMILGGVIGSEREAKHKPAGLRTNMIIAGAATLCIAMGRIILTDYGNIISQEAMGADPTRIIHAVIVGVGFMGAGVILKSADGKKVHYLTTAATIWMSAAIGIVIGLHQYILAVGVTLFMLIVNTLINKIQKMIFDNEDDDK